MERVIAVDRIGTIFATDFNEREVSLAVQQGSYGVGGWSLGEK